MSGLLRSELQDFILGLDDDVVQDRGNGNYAIGLAIVIYEHQQPKVDELQADVALLLASHKRMSVGPLQQQDNIEKLTKERNELQKRLEALIQKYKDEDRELKLIDEWEKSQIYGLVASELEQALKGAE